MKKFIIPIIIIGILTISGVILFKNKIFAPQSTQTQPTSESQTLKEEKPKEAEKINYGKVFAGEIAVCQLFPKEKIEELTGKQFLEIKPGQNQTQRYTEYYCEYHEEKLPYSVEHGNPPQAPKNITISFVRGDISSLKEAYKLTQDLAKKDNAIPFPHQLIYNRQGKFLRLEVFLADDLEIIINTWWSTLTQEEAEKFVKDFSLYLKDFVQEKAQTNNQSDSSITKVGNEIAGGVPLPQEEDIINNFFSLIETGDISKAVSMMKIKNDSEKQAWAGQFNAFNYVQVLKIEKASENEWSDNKHIYKITLDVIMKPESGSAPIPYYGYQNGQNIRFITLEKDGSLWKIAEIGGG